MLASIGLQHLPALSRDLHLRHHSAPHLIHHWALTESQDAQPRGNQTHPLLHAPQLLCRRPDNKPLLGNKRAPEITAEALDGDPIALEAVDIFLSIIGAEAGAMALRCLARGGVFIAGGIVPRLLQRVKGGVLMDAFVNKTARDRFQYLLQNMPLFVVTNTKVGIVGSREYAKRLVLDV